jgi:hypothetical protein
LHLHENAETNFLPSEALFDRHHLFLVSILPSYN